MFGLHAQEAPKKFKDSLDGAFDMSYFLKDLHGVLPIASPITEPAVGYGATAAVVYFITKEKTDKGYRAKPDIAGVGAGYTQNGTWFAGGGYLGFWKNDRVRYRGVLGYGDVNLTYYTPGNLIPNDRAYEFNIKSSFLLQQVISRIGETPFFIGGKYVYAKTRVRFDRLIDVPELDPRDFELTNSGISVIGEYENLNNILSPSNGMRIHLSYDQNLEIIGSDRNWGRATFFTQFYFPVNNIWVPALRFESQLATGEIPFYAKPFVYMRGIPAMRYQGDLTTLIETEHSFTITPRWSVVGFAGAGTAFRNIDDLTVDEVAWSAGAGFRYLIARLFGLKMGLDVARGPEEWAVYVVFGSSWLR